MPGQIALVGGEEFRIGCEEMDRELMSASGASPARVVVIPTAAVTGPAKAANDGAVHFGALGGDSSKLMVLNGDHANDADFVSPVANADVVYFTGGDPNHLLQSLRESHLVELLLERLSQGMVLAGSSAGAMVMGSVMRQPGAVQWVDGLNIAPGVAILPHHERRDQAETSRELQDGGPSGVTYLGIDARTGVLGNPGDWRTVGRGKVTVYQGSEWAVFSAGDKLPAGF